MDPKTRFKQLQDIYTAGYVDTAEFNELRAALLNLLHGAKTPTDRSSVANAGEEIVPTSELWLLERSLEIGPPQNRLRLMRQLGDGGTTYQTWLGDSLVGSEPERYRALRIVAPSSAILAENKVKKPGKGLSPLQAWAIRFKTRVEIVTHLQHPNIAPTFGWGQDSQGWLFSESEYIDHRASLSFEKLLIQEGRPGLSWKRALELIRPVVEALNYAQRTHRLAHHHLNAGNVFLTEDSTVKVVDFGLLYQPLDEEAVPSILDDEPTQNPGSATAGQMRFKRDVSALAILLYRLFSGKAWPAETPLDKLKKPAELNDAAWFVLQQALVYQSDSCPSSANELLQRLESAKAIINVLEDKQPDSSMVDFDQNAERFDDEEDQEESFANFLDRLQGGLTIGPAERRFRILRKLGDSGRVWLASEQRDRNKRDRQDRQYKALKIFAPHSAEELQNRSSSPRKNSTISRVELLNLRAALVRLRAKAEVSALLTHPNIIKLYGWRQGKDGWPFVEMDYLDNRSGRDLQQYLQQEGPCSWEQALQLLRPIAAALDYAHQKHRLAHRNLKPTNVFVTHELEVKLMDFGLTYQPRELREAMRSRITDDLSQDSSLDGASGTTVFKQDVGALATLAYEMLTGKAPYTDESLLGRDPHTWPIMVTAQAEDGTARKTALEPEKPAELDEAAWQILYRSMNFHDASCPDSAGELLQRLEGAQTPQGRKRKTGKLWLTAVPVVLLLGVSSYLLYQWYTARIIYDGSTTTETLAAQGDSTPTEVSSTQESVAAQSDSPDQRAYDAAQRMNTLQGYRIYLQRCPDCEYRSEAEAAIVRLQRQTELNALQRRFEEHLTAWQQGEGERRDRAALEVLSQLAKQDPQAPLIVQGRRQIALSYAQKAQVALTEGRLTDAQAWLQAGQALLPDLPELASLPDDIAAARAQIQDKALYQQAQTLNTRQAYLDYLAGCGSVCTHREATEKALDALMLEPPSTANPVFRDRLKTGGLGPQLVLIPAGNVVMGSPPDDPERYSDEAQYSIQITRPFGLGLHEVSFDEYDRFAGATNRSLPADDGWGRGQRPVINITWEDAHAYTEWLSQRSGHRYRLPTEAEWEYAARAGAQSSRFWGNNPDEGCRYANGSDQTAQQTYAGWTAMDCADGYLFTAPVGSYQPNRFGVYDLLGNVMELTCSAYTPDQQGTNTCSANRNADHIVARGGSWSDEPRNVRLAERFKATPDLRANYLGFRVLREL
ncbi:MAG: SUMF1/EgtB/PvdO family nonheme iron enzyme [Candidatus Competibacteraceae bacterium]|jgi:formylglycine-generating enzyme required for sulfatase activity/serine/threonine protein kinase|nr:SUMF1/EgtB/PvdO family nonheme iron enzyme [Candidatus Competibacteraceae bacterium]